MKKKNYTPLYAVLQAMVWGGFGVVISYAAPYFKALGMTDGQYGLILGLVSFLSFFVQLGLAEVCSRLKRMTLQRLLVGLGIGMVICCIALFSLPLKLLFICLLYCLTAVVVQVLPSLVNALGMAGLDKGLSINFGVARGIGSASFAVFSFLTGQLIPKIGERAVPLLYILIGAVLVVSALCFPKVDTAQAAEKSKGASLWKNGRLLMVLLGCTLLYVSHNFLCNFLFQVAVDRGGNEADQGICLAIAAFCELPVMFLFTGMLKLGRCDMWLKLSGLFMGLRVFGCYLAASVGALYAVQLFQLLGFALFSVSSVIYIDSLVEAKDTVRAQAMLASTCTLSNIIAFLLGGSMMDSLGVNAVLLFSTACAAAGAMILIIFANKLRRTAGTDPEELQP